MWVLSSFNILHSTEKKKKKGHIKGTETVAVVQKIACFQIYEIAMYLHFWCLFMTLS